MKSAVLALIATVAVFVAAPACADDPLPSWKNRRAKKAVTDFVKRVTCDSKSPDFCRPAERIAVFDNDGTLWSEQPLYFHAMFAIDRIKAEAPKHSEWKDLQPYKGILEGDWVAALDHYKHFGIELLAESCSGMTTEEFATEVNRFLKTAKHPQCQRLYTDLVYQPMLEVLEYLRANCFKNYIVSGGDVEFLKPLASKFYHIPPGQVIGSSVYTKFKMLDGKQVQVRLPNIAFIAEGERKAAAIKENIVYRPTMAFGNSDGDLEMLQWTTAGPGPRFGLIIHHTDEDREWAHDSPSRVGKLDRALDRARGRWTVVDMKKDWNVIYSFQGKKK
jgi:phosphoglycolate phosphatase-like HAD superfamily hydrolase